MSTEGEALVGLWSLMPLALCVGSWGWWAVARGLEARLSRLLASLFSSQSSAEARELRAKAAEVAEEISRTSAQDSFAVHAKLRRRLAALKRRAEEAERSTAGGRLGLRVAVGGLLACPSLALSAALLAYFPVVATVPTDSFPFAVLLGPAHEDSALTNVSAFTLLLLTSYLLKLAPHTPE